MKTASPIYSCCTPIRTRSKSKNEAFRKKLLSFLGVCGCFSCYVAMFPAILIGIIGIFGISSQPILGGLGAYMNSALFQPVLIVSLLFLTLGIVRYGSIPFIISIAAGIGVFTSMNFFMEEWLFTFSFGLFGISYFLAFRKTKVPALKFATVLLAVIVLFGLTDLARSILSR